MATPRLPVAQPARESEGRKRADIHREASAAWDRTVAGRTDVIATALGVGPDLIRKQARPHCPQQPPSERVLVAVLAAIEDGADPAEAMATVEWMLRRLGRISVPLPTADVSDDSLAAAIATSAHEFGQAMSVAAARLGRCDVPPLTHELERLHQETSDAVRALLSVVELIEARADQARLNDLNPSGAAATRRA